MNIRTIISVVVTGILFTTAAFAVVPNTINYQGILTDSLGNTISGSRQMIFSIYPNEIIPIPLWSETQPAVEVVDGLFHAQLGSVNSFPTWLFTGDALWLGIRVSPDPAELMPRQPLVTVPFGFKSEEADHTLQADTAHYSYSAGTASSATFAAEANNASHAIRADTAQFALSATPDNDWTISGSNIYRMTGNVGIGTATPTIKLDVLGNVNADSLYKIRGNTVLSIGGTQNVMVGKAANPNNAGGDGVFVGDSAGYSNQEWLNTFIGAKAGRFNSTGYGNSFLGFATGYRSTTGIYNTFLGESAGNSNTTGSYNTYIGNGSAGNNSAGNWNTFLGNSAGWFNTGSHNVFLGYNAGYNETGSNKLYIANGANNSDVLIYGDFATDRIGMGTTNPDAALQIGSGTHSPFFVNTTMQLDYNDVDQHGIEIINNSGSSIWGINTSGHAILGTQTSGKHLFLETGSNTRMTILGTNGYVGLGTTTPDVPMQIGDGTHSPIYSNTSMQLDYNDNNQRAIEIVNNSGSARLGINSLGDVYMGSQTTGKNLYLMAGNTVGQIFDGTTGYVGIGPYNPDVPLQIGNGMHSPYYINTTMQLDFNDTQQHGIEIQNNSGSSLWGITSNADVIIGSQTYGKNLYLLADNALRVTIQGTTGNVGIGTVIPTRLLHVYGNANPRILVEAPSGQAPELNLQRGTTTHAMYINDGNDLVFYQAGDHVTFTDDGKVGVGTTAPTHQLTVNAAGTDDVLRLVGPDGGALGYGARLNFGDGDYAYLDEVTDDHLEIHALGIALNGNEISVQLLDGTTSGNQVMWYNGKLYYYSSSRKYKDDIKPLQENFDKILDAEPVSFTDKVSGERNIGFIAEEFDKLGLENLVVHRDGEPDAIKYELVSLYLLEVIKNQNTKIEELTQRIETIEKNK